MPHQIGLVRYEAYAHAWVLDLPGSIAGAPDFARLDEPLALAIAEYKSWLRHHGETPDDITAWEIAEELDGVAAGKDGGEFCFDAYKEPLERDELEKLIVRMTYARTDLDAALASLSDGVLDWEPPATAIGPPDPWAPEPRTIRGVSKHVLQLEVYYRDSLRDGPARGIFEQVGTPAAERAETLTALRALDDAGRSRVFRPIHPSRTVPEDWTVRKAIARMLSHERVHTAEIWQRRSWLLLGTPVIERR